MILTAGGIVSAAALAMAVAAPAAQHHAPAADPGPDRAAARPSAAEVTAPAADVTAPAAKADKGAVKAAASPSATTAKPSAGTGAAKLDDGQARSVIKDGLAATLEQPDTAKQLQAAVEDVAAQDYLDELETQWQELEAFGWSLEGKPRVLSAEVTSRSVKQRTVVVSACIDSSGLRFLDADGEAINSKATRPGPATQIFTVQQGKDSHWRIVERSFPADPACGTDSESRTSR